MHDAIREVADDHDLRRHRWQTRREALEAAPAGRKWRGRVRHHLYGTAQAASRLLQPTGLYRRVTARAVELGLTRLMLSFPELPPAFDGYTILHLTDLHLDNIDGTAEATARTIAGLGPDLCVVTGDVRDNIRAPIAPIIERLGHIVAAARAKDGAIAILGNHDSAAMVAPMEALGIRVLCNEIVHLRRDGATIHVTGLDDVHRFHTEAQHVALDSAPATGFGIALVHSPEIAGRAAKRHRLYLTGHTHGGQICLPGGRALTTGLKRHRDLARGLWEHGGMIGYTSRGIGASVIPLRWNCQGEVVLVTLRHGPQAGQEIRSCAPRRR